MANNSWLDVAGSLLSNPPLDFQKRIDKIFSLPSGLMKHRQPETFGNALGQAAARRPHTVAHCSDRELEMLRQISQDESPLLAMTRLNAAIDKNLGTREYSLDHEVPERIERPDGSVLHIAVDPASDGISSHVWHDPKEGTTYIDANQEPFTREDLDRFIEQMLPALPVGPENHQQNIDAHQRQLDRIRGRRPSQRYEDDYTQAREVDTEAYLRSQNWYKIGHGMTNTHELLFQNMATGARVALTEELLARVPGRGVLSLLNNCAEQQAVEEDPNYERYTTEEFTMSITDSIRMEKSA